jgi:cyclopropane fatty-acyl-phospholipid synthase-like methyltransferase
VSFTEIADRSASPIVEELAACPSCHVDGLDVFHEQESIPVHSCRLVETREDALSFPRGRLRLALCRECGFITNVAYEPCLQDYGLAYEETQGFSPTFQEFARALAVQWIERYDLRGKRVLEIGCGKGEFLSLVCELGENAGVGIDPAFVETRLRSAAAERMSFIRDVYDERYAHIEADAIVCRHTIEHIAPVAAFLALIRRTIGERSETAVLFDLPDARRVFREPAFWDIYYEHCSYFTAGSLARLFRHTGFRVVALERAYDDQYLVIEAFPATHDGSRPLPLEESPEELAEDVSRFRRRFAQTTIHWRDLLGAARADGRRTAVWGAGSKGVAFLTTLALGDEIGYAIDINPYKQGKFLAGTGHAVVGPAHLTIEPPDLVVAMNEIYLPEIRRELDARGLRQTQLVAV